VSNTSHDKEMNRPIVFAAKAMKRPFDFLGLLNTTSAERHRQGRLCHMTIDQAPGIKQTAPSSHP
jgi:hypothetical protein